MRSGISEMSSTMSGYLLAWSQSEQQRIVGEMDERWVRL